MIERGAGPAPARPYQAVADIKDVADWERTVAEIADLLDECELFQDIKGRDGGLFLRRIAEQCRISRTYQAGERVSHQKQVASHVWVCRTGRIRVQVSGDRILYLAFGGRGHHLGEMSTLLKYHGQGLKPLNATMQWGRDGELGQRSADVIAEEETSFVLIPAELYARLLAEDHDVLMRLALSCARRTRQMMRRVTLLNRPHDVVTVADYLLLASTTTKNSRFELEFQWPRSQGVHGYISGSVHCSARSVEESLNKLAQLGLICKQLAGHFEDRYVGIPSASALRDWLQEQSQTP